MNETEISDAFQHYVGTWSVPELHWEARRAAWGRHFALESADVLRVALGRAEGTFQRYAPTIPQIKALCDQVRGERENQQRKDEPTGPMSVAEWRDLAEQMAHRAGELRAEIAECKATSTSPGTREKWADFLEQCAEVYARNAIHRAEGTRYEPRPKLGDIFRVMGMDPARLREKRRSAHAMVDDARETEAA